MPIGSALALVPVVREIYGDRATYLARTGLKFIGVKRFDHDPDRPGRRYFQLRVSAAEAVVVTGAGLAYRTRFGWRRRRYGPHPERHADARTHLTRRQDWRHGGLVPGAIVAPVVKRDYFGGKTIVSL